jgi:hypothetical protein
MDDLMDRGFVEVLGGRCELSYWELQRRAARPPVPADLQRIEVRL